MEVILNKTIDNLGLEGDVVNVKPGYARNYLLPQNLALQVTKENMVRLQQTKDAIQARLDRDRKEAEALSAKLGSVTIQIERRVGEDERLFGSVTSADIAEKLAEKSIIIERKSILLGDPIKSIGDTNVSIKVGYQMTTDIIIQVVPEQASEE